jgi:hypothetical protein
MQRRDRTNIDEIQGYDCECGLESELHVKHTIPVLLYCTRSTAFWTAVACGEPLAGAQQHSNNAISSITTMLTAHRICIELAVILSRSIITRHDSVYFSSTVG